jgi:hypothetical protein
MNLRDSNKLARSVRLFPRLATPSASGQMSRRRARLATRRTNGAPDTDSRESASAQVRARLLEMILDNERVRRNERRPNQG